MVKKSAKKINLHIFKKWLTLPYTFYVFYTHFKKKKMKKNEKNEKMADATLHILLFLYSFLKKKNANSMKF